MKKRQFYFKENARKKEENATLLGGRGTLGKQDSFEGGSLRRQSEGKISVFSLTIPRRGGAEGRAYISHVKLERAWAARRSRSVKKRETLTSRSFAVQGRGGKGRCFCDQNEGGLGKCVHEGGTF